MPKGRDKVTIKIPRELYLRLGTLIEGKGFGSVTEYIVYVMRNVAAGMGPAQDAGLTPRETELIRNHLRALGYLE
jgi:hypothetical protein